MLVETFIESTQALPASLRKNLNLMRELDQQCESVMSGVTAQEQAHLEALKYGKNSGLLDSIGSAHTRAINLSNEKVQLAKQIYDQIDKCIVGLDDMMRRYELRRGDEPQDDYVHDIPLDPADEPLYCYCRQVSFGEMIACDSPKCEYEWFHFDCLGINQAPKGRWICPYCAEKRK
eukprot:TRINITY_DN56625_c0_g1_i1.p1 TRINITY_DN56625_c0_g1~~TRINITY_DN56625_c0_g1_i1.p1  ORF type:complete len:176 (-),score=24.98 TRINITY_DN56625_c0_g1_i1:86-613(-)